MKAKNVKDVPARLEAMQQQVRQLQKDNESLSAKLGNLEAGNLVNEVIEIDGVAVLAKKVEASDMDGLRSIVDQLKQDLKSGIIVLAAVNGQKVNIVAGVTKDLMGKFLYQFVSLSSQL